MEYLNFDISIDVHPDDNARMRVQVLSSPAGEAQEDVECAPDLTLRSNAKAFGRRLFEALFVGDVLQAYRSSEAIAAVQQSGLRIRLRTSSASVACARWELLFDPERDDYVALSRRTLLVRYSPLSQPAPAAQPVQWPLRILGMAAAPSNVAALDLAGEIKSIRAALDRLTASGVMELAWLEGGTLRALQRATGRGGWHVFHFIGHGAFERGSKVAAVVVQDERGRSRLIDAETLARLLNDASVRLVILNCCYGASSDDVELLASTAGTIVKKGVPAVLAMQGAIPDSAAVILAGRFYECVAAGTAVDLAITEARIAMAAEKVASTEWSLPALYLRSQDGYLFTIPEVPPATPGEDATPILEGAVDRIHLAWMCHPKLAAALCVLGSGIVALTALVLGVAFDFSVETPAGGRVDAEGFWASPNWALLLWVGMPIVGACFPLYLRVLNNEFARLDRIILPVTEGLRFSQVLSDRLRQQWPWLLLVCVALALGLTILADGNDILSPLSQRLEWLPIHNERDWSNLCHLQASWSACFGLNIGAFSLQTVAIYAGLMMFVSTLYLFAMSLGHGLARTELVDIFSLSTKRTQSMLFRIQWDHTDKRCGLGSLDKVFLGFHLLILAAAILALASVVVNMFRAGPDTGASLLTLWLLAYWPIDLLWILYPYWSRFPKRLPAHLRGKPGYVEPSPWPMGSAPMTWTIVIVVTVIWCVLAVQVVVGTGTVAERVIP